ncbi:MAG: DUF4097 family beta strand repeat-containing protein [Bacillota bacterium]|nr:DUF4097 family beta strand repeat-containing protein [Bacillota bacterium]
MKKAFAALLVLTFIIFALSGCRTVNINSGDISEFNYDNPEKYLTGDAEITDTVENIEIEWIGGSINVSYYDKDTVSFFEESDHVLNDDTSVHYMLDGTTLKIKFCKSGILNMKEPEKDLTICIPESLSLKNLNIDGISADVAADEILADKIYVNTLSGGIQLTGCIITDKADLDSISGSINADITESVKTLNCSSVSGEIDIHAQEIVFFSADTASGDVRLSSGTAPKELNIDTVSGEAYLQLPENSDFSLETDTVSGDFSSDIPCKGKDGNYIFGNGDGEYEIDTISGDINIAAYNYI